MAFAAPLALGLQAVSSIAGGIQANNQGKAIQASENEAARVDRQQGSANEDSVRRRNAQVLGAQRAAAAQSGFQSNTGSLADLQTQNAGELELDALTGRYQSELSAIGHENRGRSARAAGKAARTQAFISAAGSILGAGYAYGNSGLTLPNIPGMGPSTI
jgi:hypothetical protein